MKLWIKTIRKVNSESKLVRFNLYSIPTGFIVLCDGHQVGYTFDTESQAVAAMDFYLSYLSKHLDPIQVKRVYVVK